MTARLATLALLVLAACSGEGPADGSDPKRTPSTPADTDADADADADADVDTDTDTDTDTTTTAEMDPVVIEPVAPVDPPVLFSGALATCEGSEGRVIAEFIGPVGVVEASPIVGGALLDPVAMSVDDRRMFRRAEATVPVADCSATGWHVRTVVDGAEACMVTGPGAADWLAASGLECTLR